MLNPNNTIQQRIEHFSYLCIYCMSMQFAQSKAGPGLQAATIRQWLSQSTW